MGERSKIEWTDSTWPIVQGCDPVSPGCANCYAVPLVHRLAWNTNPKISAPIKGVVAHHKDRLRFTGKVALREDRMDWPLKWKKGRMIFVPSHGDLFHKDVPDAFIDRVFAVMALTPQHSYQVLTKRAERMRDYIIALHDGKRAVISAAREICGSIVGGVVILNAQRLMEHVWLGISAEDQQRADERIPLLLQTPAAVRFVSLEPLLGPIDLTDHCNGHYFFNSLSGTRWHDDPDRSRPEEKFSPGLDWVIVGGESGPHARPMHPEWVRSLRNQCEAAAVPFFLKQWGEWLPGEANSGQFDATPMHAYRRCDNHSYEWPNTSLVENFGTHVDKWSGNLTTRRVGKRAAGRLLDGREWNGMPERGQI